MDNEITIPPPARRGWSDDARAPGCGRGRHVTASRRASVPPRPIVANSWQGALVSALTTLLLLIATDPPRACRSELQESAERCPAEGTAHRRPGWLAKFPGRGRRDLPWHEDVGRHREPRR